MDIAFSSVVIFFHGVVGSKEPSLRCEALIRVGIPGKIRSTMQSTCVVYFVLIMLKSHTLLCSASRASHTYLYLELTARLRVPYVTPLFASCTVCFQLALVYSTSSILSVHLVPPAFLDRLKYGLRSIKHRSSCADTPDSLVILVRLSQLYLTTD